MNIIEIYADLRVLPAGIGSLESRMIDTKERYPKYANREDFPALVQAAFDLEKQIQTFVTIPLTEIDQYTKNYSTEQILAECPVI